MCESGITVVVLRVRCACVRLKTLFKPLWRALVARQHYNTNKAKCNKNITNEWPEITRTRHSQVPETINPFSSLININLSAKKDDFLSNESEK